MQFVLNLFLLKNLVLTELAGLIDLSSYTNLSYVQVIINRTNLCASIANSCLCLYI